MQTRIFILLFVIAESTIAQHGWFSFAEGFSSAGSGKPIEISFRAHTAPSLQELQDSGIVVDRLDIEPQVISVRVGDAVPLDQLTITAFDNLNRLVERVPLSFIFEGPENLLDFDAFKASGEAIKATTPGTARIWVDTLLPTSIGQRIRKDIVLTIE